MPTHSFHTSACNETKGKSIGPILSFLAMAVGIIAPFNVIPQIITIFQTKSVANISLTTYVIVIVTQLVWLVYGLKLALRPLAVSSLVVILLSSVIVFQFFLFGHLF